jgi:diguanylate cyclase (GGDEF)-like protein
MTFPRQLAAAAVRHVELLLALGLVLVGAWLSLNLVREPAASAAPVSWTLSVVPTSQADQLRELLQAPTPIDYDEGVVSAAEAQASKRFFRLTIDSRRTSSPSLTLELQRAYHAYTSVWRVVRDPQSGQELRYERQLVSQGTRGALVAFSTTNASEVELLLNASNLRTLKPKLTVWDTSQFYDSENYLRHVNGVTLGVFLFLAAFSALIALIARDQMFLFFAGWSLTSLRTVAVNEGWATNWLHETFSSSVIPTVIGATIALHCLFTMLLFSSIFKLPATQGWLNRVRVGLCLASVIATLLSPFATEPFFYPMVWSMAGAGTVTIITSLVIAWKQSKAAVLFWYSCFWVVTLAGLVGEIIYAAGLLGKPSPLLNAQTGATLGALVMAVTLAQHFIEERLERRRAQNAEVDALKRLANTYGSMPIGLFRMEQSGEITVFNPAFGTLFGLEGPPSPSRPLKVQTIFGDPAYDALLEVSNRTETTSCHVSVNDSSGAQRHLQFTARRSGEGVEGSVQDITARVTAENALARLVDHDVQTKALNQRGLNDAVKRAVQLAASGTPCALIELDVDRFKTLNDLYGHLVGDLLLAAVCDRLIQELRPGDEIARIGDSFRIVLFSCDPEESTACASRLHQAISGRPIEVAGRILTVSASVGLVPIDEGMEVRDVIAASSQACAEAKLKGRNRIVHMAKQDLALRGYLEELKVQENLQDKINSQRFFLEYQPIVSFRSAFETLNYEVLVRMRGENGSTISPGRFIPAAERNGQMSLIDRWVLLKTLHWLNDHTEHLKRLDYATINLSGSSLNDARFVDNIFSMISDFPNVMNKLCFEITETVALADRRATRRFSERVHSMGGKVALDDFGAGYTSFTYLREIEADIIKIDGSFVRDINQNPANHAITRMIVELSHELGKRCVAEWAEHPDVIATLMQLGVDYGQGYALARPMAPEALLFAGSCGDLVTEPTVRALLKGTLSPEQMAAKPTWTTSQTALF